MTLGIIHEFSFCNANSFVSLGNITSGTQNHAQLSITTALQDHIQNNQKALIIYF